MWNIHEEERVLIFEGFIFTFTMQCYREKFIITITYMNLRCTDFEINTELAKDGL